LAVANIADLSTAFQSAVVDAVAIVGHKLDKDRIAANSISVQVAGENGTLRHKSFPQNTLLEVFGGAANIYAEPTDIALYQHLKRLSLPLGEICDVKDGIIQGAVEDIAFVQERLDKDSKPLLFGSDVQRFSIDWSGYFVNYKPDLLLQKEMRRLRGRGSDGGPGLRLRNPAIFERTKILTRQTADRIIGAIDRSNRYYANTLHGMAVMDTRFSPELVLGILNSSLTDFVYSILTGEVGKVFAQVKIETLRKLPIRDKISQEIKGSVESLVHELETETQDAKRRALVEALDEIVFDMYELSTGQVAYVRKRLEQTYGK